MIVFLVKEGIVDMRQALMNTLNSFNQQRDCPYCLNVGIKEKWQFNHTWQLFLLQIASLSSRCILLQNSRIQLVSEIVKKRQLECIIERSDNNAYS